MNRKIKIAFKGLLWLLEGIVVGFGAIMPGISGGTLCVAFGMYRSIIELISNPKENIRKYGKKLTIFIMGAIFGFIGLSGVTSWLMDKNSVIVTCLFTGLIIGTFPQLWKDAGIKGRNKKSYISMIFAFVIMLVLMTMLQTNFHLKVQESVWGFLFCGILWGLSFIVPGLSSSTLLLFFGLYQPMLDGIAGFNLFVLIPLVIGMIVCVLLLSKVVTNAYKKHYSIISHSIIGVVASTVVMILPFWNVSAAEFLSCIFSIGAGIIMSFMFSKICSKLEK